MAIAVAVCVRCSFYVYLLSLLLPAHPPSRQLLSAFIVLSDIPVPTPITPRYHIPRVRSSANVAFSFRFCVDACPLSLVVFPSAPRGLPSVCVCPHYELVSSRPPPARPSFLPPCDYVFPLALPALLRVSSTLVVPVVDPTLVCGLGSISTLSVPPLALSCPPSAFSGWMSLSFRVVRTDPPALSVA